MTREMRINLRVLAKTYGLGRLIDAVVETDDESGEQSLIIYGDKK